MASHTGLSEEDEDGTGSFESGGKCTPLGDEEGPAPLENDDRLGSFLLTKNFP